MLSVFRYCCTRIFSLTAPRHGAVGAEIIVGFRGEVVNGRCFYPLSVLVAVVMLISGCGTTKLPDLADLKGNKPWIFLAGAEVRQAKSLAMGAAVTKGWKIVDAAGDKLLVRRPLSTTTAEAIAGEPVATAAIEVKTDFDQRRAGVDVIVAAAMVADKLTDKGEKSALRVDVTESYKEALNRSLNALRQSWGRNRWRIAAAMRPLPTKGTVSEDEDRGDTFGTGADRKTDTPAPSPPKKTAAAPIAASSTGDRAVTAVAPSTHSGPAPVEDRALSTPRSVTLSTPDRAVTAVAPSTRSGPAPVEDRALSTPRSVTLSTPDRAVAATAPSTRDEVAPVGAQTLSTPYPMTPSTTDSTLPTAAPIGVWGSDERAMTAVPPVGMSSRAALIEDRVLARPRPMTPNALDRAMAAIAPPPRDRVALVEDRALSTPRPITPTTTPSTASAAGPTDIPALDHARKAGAWAYYAE